MPTTNPIKLREKQKRYRARRRKDPTWAAEEKVRLADVNARRATKRGYTAQLKDTLKKATLLTPEGRAAAKKAVPLLLANPVTVTAPAKGKIAVQSSDRGAPVHVLSTVRTPLPIVPESRRKVVERKSRKTEPIIGPDSEPEKEEWVECSEPEAIESVVTELGPDFKARKSDYIFDYTLTAERVRGVLEEARSKARAHPKDTDTQIVARFWDKGHRAILTALIEREADFRPIKEPTKTERPAGRERTVLDVLSGSRAEKRKSSWGGFPV